MTSIVRVVGDNDLEIDDSLLSTHVIDANERQVAAARALAHRDGRVIERDGLLVASLGIAARIILDGGLDGVPMAVGDVLSSIAVQSGNSQVTPIAIGALPFDLTTECEFTVGQITVVERLGHRPQIIFVGTDTDRASSMERDLIREALDLDGEHEPSPPDHFSLDAPIPHEQFREKVAAAIEAISTSTLEKVVLAREVVITANRPFYQADLLRRLRALHPSCMSFAVDGFIGATPELLIRRVGEHVTSIPIAGTIARSGDPEVDARRASALFQSPKDRAEHQYVVDEIAAQLRVHSRQLDIQEAPHILELRNVVHLATTIKATLADNYPSALELAVGLHPTPAVCGTPTPIARTYIDEHEGLSRDLYAGLVGYVDASGDGEWWIGIRSAMIEGSTARLFAGVGVVRDSDPAFELAETQLKLQALLAVLVRP